MSNENILDNRETGDRILNSADLASRLLNGSVDAILIGDALTLKLIYANPAAEKMLGLPEARILELSVHDIHPAECLPYVIDQFKRQVSGEILLAENIPVRHADGTVNYYDVQSTPMELQGRSCLLGCFKDATVRRKALSDLEARERIFELALESLPMGLLLYRLEPDNRLVFKDSNPAADRILGMSGRSLAGKTIEEIFPPLAATEIPDIYRSLASGGGVWHNQQVQYDDGKIGGAYEVVAFQLRYAYTAVLFWDVTERMKAEAEMRKLMAAVSSVDASVVITDTEGLIEYVNPCFENMTGYSGSEVIGRPISMLKSGRHDKEYYSHIWDLLNQGRPWSGYFVNRRKDGSLFEEYATISPVRAADGRVTSYVAVKRDMSHIRELERKVTLTQKMVALGQFAHRIAHDITNGLSTIMGCAEIIGRTSNSPDVKEMSAEIVSAIDRMGALTSSLMSFASPVRMNPRRHRLALIIRGMHEMIRHACGPAVALEFDMDEGCEIECDSLQVEQAVMHLVINAVEAITDTGTIRITVRRGIMETGGGDGDLLEVVEVPAAVLEMSDNGAGIDAEQCLHVFEPFFTTKKDFRRNAGLGLATVYGIVSGHRGDISFSSEKGKGSTVRICLPLAG